MVNVPRETIVCALSGISGPDDVKAYRDTGVGAVLVGEALMRVADTSDFATRLLGRPEDRKHKQHGHQILVKICGTRTPEAARVAIEAGADMIGIILVENRKRRVSGELAHKISDTVHRTPKGSCNAVTASVSEDLAEVNEYFVATSSFFQGKGRALLVGVFQNQSLSYILARQRQLNLDVVQLHGNEPMEWASLIPVPVIRRFSPADPGLARRGYYALPLLDSASGGTGEKQDINAVKSALSADHGLRVVLAGGLDAENIGSVIASLKDYSSQVIAVDVSSGIEENSKQDHEKIRKFIKAAKSPFPA